MNYPLRTDLAASPIARSARHWLVLLLSCAAAGCDQPPIDAMDSGVGACRTDLAILCEGDDRIARDVCTGVSTLVEACPGACYRGACVECAPHAGRLCIDGQVRDVDSCGNAGDVLETCIIDETPPHRGAKDI